MKVRSRHNSKRNKTTRIIVVSIVMIGLSIILPKTISLVSEVLMYPIHSTNLWLENSTSLVPTFIRDRESLGQEIEDLKNKLVVAKSSSLTQQRMVQENDRLRKLLSVSGETRVGASVIARPDELPYDFLQIDRGSDHGVEVGAPVFAGSDVVIGLIVHTADKYSFVEMITTHGFEATSFIVGPNVVAVLEGMGGGVARVKVPQGIPLVVGNLVYLPSIEPGVFGRITRVDNDPTQPEQYGYISPDIAISGLFQVSVGELSQISRSANEISQNVIEIISNELLVDMSGINMDTEASTTEQQIKNEE